MKLGLAQLNSRQNKEHNLAAAGEAIAKLAAQGADLVMLPEVSNFHGLDADYAVHAEPDPGPFTEWCRGQARKHGIYLHCGSFGERRADESGAGTPGVALAPGAGAPGAERVYNTSVVYDRAGEVLARYSKIHLFDAVLPDGLAYQESAAFAPGDAVVCCDCDGVRFGLAICYDVRFPELFHALADMGAQVFLLPAAFTIPTGISQWEPCLRARAIENGCYAAGCGQWGRYARGRENYGHSMVVDPWGTVIAQCSEGVGTLCVDLDLDYLESVRQRLPIQQHRRRDLFG
jgi:predicted amidohydrolase